jgi:hypothetical protein
MTFYFVDNFGVPMIQSDLNNPYLWVSNSGIEIDIKNNNIGSLGAPIIGYQIDNNNIVKYLSIKDYIDYIDYLEKAKKRNILINYLLND